MLFFLGAVAPCRGRPASHFRAPPTTPLVEPRRGGPCGMRNGTKSDGEAPPSRCHVRCCRLRRRRQFDPFEGGEEEDDRLVFSVLLFVPFALALARFVVPNCLARARALDVFHRIRGRTSEEQCQKHQKPTRSILIARGERESVRKKGAGGRCIFSLDLLPLVSVITFFCFFVSHPLFSLSLALLSPKPKPKPKIRSRNFTSSPGRTRAPRSPSRCPREAPPSCAPGPTSSSSRARSRRWRS